MSTIGTVGLHSGASPDLDDASHDESVEKYEIHRDDLLDILFASVEGSVEVVFGQTISQLEEGPGRRSGDVR